MLYRFSIVFLIGLCLVACSSGSMQEESVPVIRFKPDEARTLKMSGLFDGYEVLTFKGIVCNRIGDFVKMGDRIVATSIVTEGMTDVVTLSVFDSAGEFQHTLGRFGRGPDEYLYLPHEIVLTPDSNVLAGDVLGFHCYALDGTLLWQKRSEHPSYEYGVGYFTWMLNDSCAVYLNTPVCGSTYRSEECLVNLVNWKSGQLKISYFPGQKVGKYAVRNKSYVVNDTFCYYSDIDNSIYQVSEDTVTLRYYLDKGSFKNFRLCGKAGYSDNCLTVIEMSENNKYVLIVVLVNQKYYLLVYDKLKKVTCNYDLVDDDLLSVGNFRYKPNAVLRLYHNWNPGMRQCDDYMYFYFPSSDYCMMLDRLKASLNEEQWEAYRRAHPDLMKIYREQGEEGNTVVVGYRFK